MIILARLLEPSDFGVIAIATIIIGYAKMFQDFGIGAAVIQNNEIDKKFLSTAFFTQLSLSVILVSLIFIFSGIVSNIYEDAIYSKILKVLSISLLFNSSYVIQRSLIIRKIDFKNLFFINITAILFSSIIAIYLARQNFGVWCLVVLRLTNEFILLIVFWWNSNWRPSFTFSTKFLTKIYDYSAPLLASFTINYWTKNLDKLIIGHQYGSQQLGLYSRGFGFILSPLLSVSKSISKPGFPLMSKNQKDLEKVKSIYLELMGIIVLILSPLMIIIFFYSDFFVVFLLGEKWKGAAYFMTVFSFLGIFRSLRSLNNNLFKALDLNKILLRYTLFTRLVTVLIILVSLNYGLKTFAILYVFSEILGELVFTWKISNLLKIKIFDFYKELKKILLACFVIISLGILSSFIEFDQLYFLLIVSTLLVVYIIILYTIKHKKVMEISQFIKYRIKNV
jgi:O-antigen/teichoic acid export membrane protein